MSERPTDFTHPNPPDDIPSPLLKQVFTGFMLPWPRKPLGKAGKPGRAKTTRSGVHRLGMKHRRPHAT